jgi:hypothetical protein
LSAIDCQVPRVPEHATIAARDVLAGVDLSALPSPSGAAHMRTHRPTTHAGETDDGLRRRGLKVCLRETQDEIRTPGSSKG